MQHGDLDGAVAVLRALTDRQPEHAEAFYNLGTALKQQDDFAGAEAALREAARLNPRLPDAHYTLGVVLWQTGRAAEAIDAFRAAIGGQARLRAGALHARHGAEAGRTARPGAGRSARR